MTNICDGCNKHPAVCMCKTTVPPDIEELLNRRISFAGQLRKTAHEYLQNKIEMKSADIVFYVLHEAQEKARSGHFNLVIWINKMEWTLEQAEKAIETLQGYGFSCKITTEVTAHYSNTDWDQEDAMHVSWE